MLLERGQQEVVSYRPSGADSRRRRARCPGPLFLDIFADGRAPAVKPEFPKHVDMLIEEERQRITQSYSSKASILSQLIYASQRGADLDEQMIAASVKRKGALLSDEAVVGNIFFVSVASLEASFNTLTFCIMHLARYPEWQDWLSEEAQGLRPCGPDFTAETEGGAKSEYTTIYPKAVRTRAFLLETMRLFTPIGYMGKELDSPQAIKTTTGKIRMPANSRMIFDSSALHAAPEVWRDINHEFDPGFMKGNAARSDDKPCSPRPQHRTLPCLRPRRAYVDEEEARKALVVVCGELIRDLVGIGGARGAASKEVRPECAARCIKV